MRGADEEISKRCAIEKWFAGIGVKILLLSYIQYYSNFNGLIFHKRTWINFWCEWVCVASEIKQLRTQEEGEEEILNILKS